MRALAMAIGAFAFVLLMLFAAVGQLGKIDHQTLVAVLAASLIAAVVVGLRSRHRGG